MGVIKLNQLVTAVFMVERLTTVYYIMGWASLVSIIVCMGKSKVCSNKSLLSKIFGAKICDFCVFLCVYVVYTCVVDMRKIKKGLKENSDNSNWQLRQGKSL